MAIAIHSPSVAQRLQAGVRRLFATPLVPTLLGVVLLTAALLKGYEAATEDLDAKSLFTTRWFVVCLVLFELGMGLWLLAGLHTRWTRWLALLTFLTFFEVALYQALTGRPSCRCLGLVALPPWYAVVFDVLAVGGLLAWRPDGEKATIAGHPGRLIAVVVALVLAGFPVLVSMVSYAPRGPMVQLRNQASLAVKVPLQLSKASVDQVLERLTKATGMRFELEPALAERWQSQSLNLGDIKTQNARAWALMELVAQRQGVPVRWTATAVSYRLVRSAPLGLVAPWLASAAILLVAAGGLLSGRLGYPRPNVKPVARAPVRA